MIRLGRRPVWIAASLAALLLAVGAGSAFGSSGRRDLRGKTSAHLAVQQAIARGPAAVVKLLEHPPSHAVLTQLEMRLWKDAHLRKELARAGRFVSTATRPGARSASNECTVEWIKIQLVPRGNSMYAQGVVGQTCVPPATEQYACGELDEFWLSDNSWHDMSYVCGATVDPVADPGQWSWAYPSAYCKSSATREYRVRAYGTAVIKGTVYGATTSWGYKYLACVS